MPADRAYGNRFVPVVLVGVGAAVLCAVAGNQPWAALPDDAGVTFTSLSSSDVGEVPAATALALVVLACWGVVLVTRGRARRAVAMLGAVAALGVAATVVVGFSSAPDSVLDAVDSLGAADPGVSRTAWYWVAVVASLVGAAAALLAVRLVPTWPEMGRRYDADSSHHPTAEAATPPEEQSPLDLWQAMDKGRDPTA